METQIYLVGLQAKNNSQLTQSTLESECFKSMNLKVDGSLQDFSWILL